MTTHQIKIKAYSGPILKLTWWFCLQRSSIEFNSIVFTLQSVVEKIFSAVPICHRFSKLWIIIYDQIALQIALIGCLLANQRAKKNFKIWPEGLSTRTSPYIQTTLDWMYPPDDTKKLSPKFINYDVIIYDVTSYDVIRPYSKLRTIPDKNGDSKRSLLIVDNYGLRT